MSAASARIGAGFLALVAVWIGVYWLWEPSGSGGMSFAEIETAPADNDRDGTTQARPVEPQPTPDPSPAADPQDPDPDGPGLIPSAEHDTPAPPAFQTYAVQARDTFERISRRFYGTIRHADAIASANPFVSPTSLRVGQLLRVPTDPDNVQGRPAEGEQTDLPDPEFIEYTVVRNDNLSALAQRFYGSLRYADVIFNANRDAMDSIDDLRIGQVLRIPSRANVLGQDTEDGGG